MRMGVSAGRVMTPPGRLGVAQEGDDGVGLLLAVGVGGAAAPVAEDHQQIGGRRRAQVQQRGGVAEAGRDAPALQDGEAGAQDVAVVLLDRVPLLARAAGQGLLDAGGHLGGRVVPDLAAHQDVRVHDGQQAVLGGRGRAAVEEAVALHVPGGQADVGRVGAAQVQAGHGDAAGGEGVGDRVGDVAARGAVPQDEAHRVPREQGRAAHGHGVAAQGQLELGAADRRAHLQADVRVADVRTPEGRRCAGPGSRPGRRRCRRRPCPWTAFMSVSRYRRMSCCSSGWTSTPVVKRMKNQSWSLAAAMSPKSMPLVPPSPAGSVARGATAAPVVEPAVQDDGLQVGPGGPGGQPDGGGDRREQRGEDNAAHGVVLSLGSLVTGCAGGRTNHITKTVVLPKISCRPK